MAKSDTESEPIDREGANGQITTHRKTSTQDSIGSTETLTTFLRSAHALFQGGQFAEILRASEQLPKIEAELNRLKEDQKNNDAARHNMLALFKSDHDADKTKIDQLGRRLEALLHDAQQKSDKLKTLETDASEMAKHNKKLEDAAAKHAQQIQSERSKLESLKAIKEKETKRCAALEAEVKHQLKDIDQLRAKAQDLRKELADLNRIAKERQDAIERANRFRTPLQTGSDKSVDEQACITQEKHLRTDGSSVAKFEQIWKQVTQLVCSSFFRNVKLDGPEVREAEPFPTENKLTPISRMVRAFFTGRKRTISHGSRYFRCQDQTRPSPNIFGALVSCPSSHARSTNFSFILRSFLERRVYAVGHWLVKLGKVVSTRLPFGAYFSVCSRKSRRKLRHPGFRRLVS
jgi:hypothetical protein